jgi:polyhydroxyalkanoate synthesis regulator phasin
MIRITLVTGAGKLERQKYDENAAKAVTGALRALGFEEDRGASAIVECAGSFKMQHDTGKNLKTVVVFPRILLEGDGAGNGLEGKVGDMRVSELSSLLPEGSPEHKIAMASSVVFERMIESMCPSWSQKKAGVAAIDDIRQRLQGLENKLLHGTPLDDAEQAFYDSVSATSLEEKATTLKELMHKQVEKGKITADERLQLLAQVKDRIQFLTEEIEVAEKSGKPKRIEALTASKSKAKDRKKKLEGIAPQPPHQLKNEAEISKLRKELEPLLAVEDGAKGRLLTLKESQAIAKKDDMLSAIRQLEVRVDLE